MVVILYDINSKHGLRMVENVQIFWFFFPIFLNTSRKKVHFNTFHKNTLFQVYAHSLAGGESYNEGACF